ncbi:MAG: DNA polymerase II large subunit, partial [Thermoplasmata archaeon]
NLKGVQGLISKYKTPEPVEKGILRAKYNVFCFKDGTVRFDMIDVPLTHFRPNEIGLSLEKAKKLGYVKDIYGNPLESPEQVLELKTQDVIPSESFGSYMIRCANFIDDLLEKYYKLPPYYCAAQKEDLIGHLAIGLAPHTSGGILCRIIGFTPAAVCFAHPFFHAAKRRNCDGDEDCMMLLLDGFLNFSRSFLPEKRGGLMDAPLVLSTRVNPREIDKEALNVDVLSKYPLEFYEATLKGTDPKEILPHIGTIAGRLDKPEQFEGFLFTHDTASIWEGPLCSMYKKLETMIEKMTCQLDLAKTIRAVDESEVASRVIETHFLPDMVGNLKSFSTQSLRCTTCGTKYRRMPLKGVCIKNNCGGKLNMTVHEKSVKKYLDVTKAITKKYRVKEYTRQRIWILENSMNSVFEGDKVKKCKLDDFF